MIDLILSYIRMLFLFQEGQPNFVLEVKCMYINIFRLQLYPIFHIKTLGFFTKKIILKCLCSKYYISAKIEEDADHKKGKGVFTFSNQAMIRKKVPLEMVCVSL